MDVAHVVFRAHAAGTGFAGARSDMRGVPDVGSDARNARFRIQQGQYVLMRGAVRKFWRFLDIAFQYWLAI
jgi:hypothetical protein